MVIGKSSSTGRQLFCAYCIAAISSQLSCASAENEKSESSSEVSKENTQDEEPDAPGSKKNGAEDSKNAKESASENDSPSEPEDEAIPKEYIDQENPFALDDSKALEAGKRIYEEDCEGCHGRSGEGGFPGTPDFSSAKAKTWKSDWLLWKISDGSGEMMPAYKGILSKEQIWQSITFIRSLAK